MYAHPTRPILKMPVRLFAQFVAAVVSSAMSLALLDFVATVRQPCTNPLVPHPAAAEKHHPIVVRPEGSAAFTGSSSAYVYGCRVSAAIGSRVRNWNVLK